MKNLFPSFLSMMLILAISSCTKKNTDEHQLPSPDDVNLNMVAVTGGSFTMGNTGSADNFGGEDILHNVSVDNFYMGQTEITQELYELVTGENPSQTKNPQMPVESISWWDAVEFCNSLSLVMGYVPCYSGAGNAISCDFSANGYRLPTEAEWEYACKAGTQTDFYGGDLVGNGYSDEPNLNAIGWYMHNSGMEPHVAGTKSPNAFNLYDMHGSVAEYCWDWYSATYYNVSPSVNPTGPSTGTERVERGGRWGIQAYWCRSSVRNKINPETALHGFRVVRSAN